jgi:AbrB family looped-hinge helix DNA binding protein
MDNVFLAKVTSKGQITLPAAVRKLLKVEKGDYLLLEKDDNGFKIRKMTLPPAESFREVVRPIREKCERENLTREDVEEAIREVRRHYKS